MMQETLAYYTSMKNNVVQVPVLTEYKVALKLLPIFGFEVIDRNIYPESDETVIYFTWGNGTPKAYLKQSSVKTERVVKIGGNGSDGSLTFKEYLILLSFLMDLSVVSGEVQQEYIDKVFGPSHDPEKAPYYSCSSAPLGYTNSSIYSIISRVFIQPRAFYFVLSKMQKSPLDLS